MQKDDRSFQRQFIDTVADGVKLVFGWENTPIVMLAVMVPDEEEVLWFSNTKKEFAYQIAAGAAASLATQTGKQYDPNTYMNPVTDLLPDENTLVVAADNTASPTRFYFAFYENPKNENMGRFMLYQNWTKPSTEIKVTHWQRLPKILEGS